MATADQNHGSGRMRLLLPNKRLIIIMVGLPARGKSYIAKKIQRYLLYLCLNAKIFNLGSYRRKKTKDTTVGHACAKFFDPKNKKNVALRDEICREGLTDLITWWNRGGHVGILDATNVSMRRRDLIRNFLRQNTVECEFDIEILYVESICNDNKRIENNIINAKLKNEDYCTVERQIAIGDFWQRIKMYESDYQKVKAMEGSYIKIIDHGNRNGVNDVNVIGHSINNYISLLILYFLIHLNLNLQNKRKMVKKNNKNEIITTRKKSQNLKPYNTYNNQNNNTSDRSINSGISKTNKTNKVNKINKTNNINNNVNSNSNNALRNNTSQYRWSSISSYAIFFCFCFCFCFCVLYLIFCTCSIFVLLLLRQQLLTHMCLFQSAFNIQLWKVYWLSNRDCDRRDILKQKNKVS